ncbi:MAG: adenylyl-sulfate kinase [Gemmatimonadaceae bacterium]
MPVYTDSHWRSLFKAVSWRTVGTFTTMVAVLVFTRRVTLSLAVGAFDLVSKIGFFWVHERLWDRIRLGKRTVAPAVIWFTGLPSAGKTTIATRVVGELRRRGHAVEHLDGDTIRDIFPHTGFSREERDAHVRRVGYLASRLEQHGVFVVASLISPYAESRQFVRGLCENFVEVYVSTSRDECERRDVKGLYAKARAGVIVKFTGVDDPYEPPTQPDVVIDTQRVSLDDAGSRVLVRVDKSAMRVRQRDGQRGPAVAVGATQPRPTVST